MRKNIPGFMSVAVLALAPILMSAGSALAFENDPNLVSYWQLDGDANDAAGINHGTLFGDPTWVDDPNRG
jgi:hypothetical protein